MGGMKMGDYIELANSYFRLLHWVDSSNAEKKNTAFRSLDKIMRFLNESDVEIIDLTSQPFSEGWAIKVMKIDDTVPEKEMVFTKMVKPIIQIKGEVVQEGEVYVGRYEAAAETKDLTTEDTGPESENVEEAVLPDENSACESIGPDAPESSLIKRIIKKVRDLHPSPVKWAKAGLAAGLLVIIILAAICLNGHMTTQVDISKIEKKIEELTVADYRNQKGEKNIVTYEIRNGDNTIIITQPIEGSISSTVDLDGNPVTVSTMNDLPYKGE